MAKTTDDLYELLVKIDKKLEVVTWRVERLEKREEAQNGRPWQVWLAVAGSLVSLPVAVWAASHGAS